MVGVCGWVWRLWMIITEDGKQYKEIEGDLCMDLSLNFVRMSMGI